MLVQGLIKSRENVVRERGVLVRTRNEAHINYVTPISHCSELYIWSPLGRRELCVS